MYIPNVEEESFFARSFRSMQPPSVSTRNLGSKDVEAKLGDVVGWTAVVSATCGDFRERGFIQLCVMIVMTSILNERVMKSFRKA